MTMAYIALGANLSHAGRPPESTLAAAATRLARIGCVARNSSLYSTRPVGYIDQPRFVNAVVSLETGLAPRSLLAELLNIEQEFGRDRSSGLRNGPRTLDLDILLMGDLVMAEPDLEIPHPRLAERAFVLVPLHEIAPQAIEPRSGKSVAELLERLRANAGDETHAVVPIESGDWRAGVDDSAADGNA
jgi:2-amino-4-hydroxy-6-hydroxymethyldihydropteridine diphosphokinase